MVDKILGIVKFYGPAKNKEGHVWGFAEILNAEMKGDVYIAEPVVKGELKDGMTVIMDLDSSKTKIRRTAQLVNRWSEDQDVVLYQTLRDFLIQDRAAPIRLLAHLQDLPVCNVPADLICLLKGTQIGEYVENDSERLAMLFEQSLKNKTGLNWLLHCDKIVQLDVEEIERKTKKLFHQILTLSEPATKEEYLNAWGSSESNKVSNDVADWIIQRLPDNYKTLAHIIKLANVGTAFAFKLLPGLEKKDLITACNQVSREIISAYASRLTYPEILDNFELFAFLDVERKSDHIVTSLCQEKDESFLHNKIPAEGANILFSTYLQKLNQASSQINAKELLEFKELYFKLEDKARLILAIRGANTIPYNIYKDSCYYDEIEAVLRKINAPDNRMLSQNRHRFQALIVLKVGSQITEKLAVKDDVFTEAILYILEPSRALTRYSSAEHVWGVLLAMSITQNTDRPTSEPAMVRKVAHLLAKSWGWKEGGELYFENLMGYFQRYIIDKIENDTRKLPIAEIAEVLPRCKPGIVLLCEGKPPSNGYIDPYCPRLNRGCADGLTNPSSNADPVSWNIMDILGRSGKSKRLNLSGRTLTNSVAGWANRIIELQSRMVCSGCNSPLKANLSYSMKYDAAYSNTRASCSQSCGAADVYFSHCYQCKEIIDSRESKYFLTDSKILVNSMGDPDQTGNEKGLFLCLHCANGGQPWCPKCGKATSFDKFKDLGRGTCKYCGHHVSKYPRKLKTETASIKETSVPYWASIDYSSFDDHPSWHVRSEEWMFKKFAGISVPSDGKFPDGSLPF